MFRVRFPQSTMGVRVIWYMDMLNVFWKTQGSWGSPVICPVHHHGFLEGFRARKNESKCVLLPIHTHTFFNETTALLTN